VLNPRYSSGGEIPPHRREGGRQSEEAHSGDGFSSNNLGDSIDINVGGDLSGARFLGENQGISKESIGGASMASKGVSYAEDLSVQFQRCQIQRDV
jgi:hypothetical protein